jgi:Domain of unknown function (DUF222)
MLEALVRAIDELAAIDPRSLSPDAAHDFVTGLMHAKSMLAVVRAEALGVWDTQRTWADDGSKTASARLARECDVSASTARRELCRARKLRSMPHTVTAVREGKLSIDHADVLAHLNTPDAAALFERDEQLLVDQLKTLRFSDGIRAAKYWLQQTQDELDLTPWDHERDGRHFNAVRTWGDTVSVGGVLDPIDGTVFVEELSRLEQREFEADWSATRAEHGDHATAEQLSRTAEQRRADALAEMARRSATLSDGTAPARPLFTVVVGYHAFSRLCELADGTVVHPGQLVPYLTASDIERIVFDGPSRVIDVGVRQRFFTGALRRAIEVRDHHCQHPSGCDVPAHRCEIDHIVPYSAGGLTAQDNGRCYCPVHNRRKRDRIDRIDDG